MIKNLLACLAYTFGIIFALFWFIVFVIMLTFKCAIDWLLEVLT